MDTLLNLLSSLYPDVDFEVCDSLMSDGVLDPDDMDELLEKLSDEFDVEIPSHEVNEDNFNSAETIFNLIERLSE